MKPYGQKRMYGLDHRSKSKKFDHRYVRRVVKMSLKARINRSGSDRYIFAQMINW